MSDISKYLTNHPFKEGVAQILDQYFDPSITKNFYGVLEAEKYNKGNTNIAKQLAHDKLVLELYYNKPNGMSVYICDLFSDWTKEFLTHHLLRMITDKCISKEIGTDWVESKGKIAAEVKSGKHATIVDKNGEPIN